MKSVKQKPVVNANGEKLYAFGGVIPHAASTLSLNGWSDHCRIAADTWWRDPKTKRKLKRNKGELLMLIVSEIAEAMEAERKDAMDEKLPHRRGVEVELADALHRIFDYAGEYGLDLDGALREKMAFNAQRKDHKISERAKKGGKKW